VLSSDDPVRVFQRFSTLDALSNGRAEVILGRGSFTESFPPTESGSLTTWIGVGGSPQSVVRAAHYGLPLMLAIIGGSPLAFVPLVELYHRALAQFEKPSRPIGEHSPGYVAATDAQAREEMWPHYAAMQDRIGRERGWGPVTRERFEHDAGPDGTLFVGSPQTVAPLVRDLVAAGRASDEVSR